NLDIRAAPFDPEDEFLASDWSSGVEGGAGVSTAPGRCSVCQFRSGNCHAVTPDITDPNICTKPECWDAKVKAHIAAERAELEAHGVKWLSRKDADGIFGANDQVQWMAAYVHLDSPHPDDPRRRTYGQLLAKAGGLDGLERFAAAAPSGKVVELVSKPAASKILMAAVDKAGPAAHEEKKRHEAEEEKKSDDAGRALRDRVAQRVLVAVVGVAEAAKVGLSRPILLAMVHHAAGADSHAAELAAKRRGFEDVEKLLKAAEKKLDDATLQGLLVEIALVDGFSVNFGGYGEQVKVMIKLTKFDLKAAEKEEAAAMEVEKASNAKRKGR
ncbi:MAG TPA: hypothetical protein VNN15_03235, partial [Solirubrobacterales bacterium]|nr:hypothetical protein [Solirubrobacterales bacterium]